VDVRYPNTPWFGLITPLSLMEPAKMLLGATATTLSSMKAIRMTGLSDISFSVIDRLRSDEIRAGGGFR
jgi:hypothetical protein